MMKSCRPEEEDAEQCGECGGLFGSCACSRVHSDRVRLQLLEAAVGQYGATAEGIRDLKATPDGTGWTPDQAAAMDLVLSLVLNRLEDTKARRDQRIIELAEELSRKSPTACSAPADFSDMTPGRTEPVRAT